MLKRAKTLEGRFWSKINKKSDNECWEGLMKPHRSGYCYLTYNYIDYVIHRLSWILHFGDIPNNLHVLHKCDNTKCCNPKHLFLGTQDDNNKDKAKKNRARGTPKLSQSQVLEIRRLYKEGWLKSELRDKFKVGWNSINKII